MSKKAQSRIAENKAKHARGEDASYLDLSHCNISYLADELFELTKMNWLKAINLSFNRIIYGTFLLDNLTNLRSIDLSNNKISNIRFLEKLTHLTSLNLSNSKISNWRTLEKLTNLTFLNVSKNQIRDTQFLEKLNALTSLDLSNTQISDCQSLGKLTSLTTLKISYNQISDIRFLEKLTNLTSLDISNNQISDLRFLENLTNLTFLTLNNNKISDTQFLEKLINLTLLNLRDNQIKDAKSLENLTNLNSLNLRNNQISNAQFLENLINLTLLNLSNNRISDLSPLLLLIKKGIPIIFKEYGSGINFYNNPLTNPPPEIVRQGNDAILRYFEEKARLEQQAQPAFIKVREAKVLIVGQGKSGKTSLRKKLEDPDAEMPAAGDTTRGIEITHLNERMPHSGESLRLNLWDFGGQNVQHFAHQLFLTGNALYILLTNERIQDQVHLPYWLHIIDMLGKKSPILLVQNMDGGYCEPLKNEASIQATFSNVQKPVYQTDISQAKTEANFGLLRHKIIEVAAALPHIEKEYLRSFQELREKIEDLALEEQHYLRWTDYLALMPELSEDLMRDYANHLTFLGVCQFFPEDAMLRDYVFLRPKWLIDALFDLILHPNLEGSRGHFSENDTFSIWKGPEYAGMHALLVRMMKEFELCYRVVGEGENFIVPQRLPGENDTYGWQSEGDTVVRFEYKFLPKGILTRLICRMHSRIERDPALGQRVWCDAVIFSLPDGKGKVFAREVYSQNVIELRATGEKRADMLNQTIQTLDDIHADPKTRFENLVVEKMVPCPCVECAGADQPGFHEYSAILKRIDKGKSTSECKKSGEDVLIDEIFGKSGVKKPQPRRASPAFGYRDEWEETADQKTPPLAFFSYSKEDATHLKEFQKHLKPLERQGLIRLWDDQKIVPGEEWDDEIKSALRNSDLIFLLLSVDFMNTDYIWDTEITEAMRRHEAGEAKVIPIKIRSCDWTGTPFAKLQGLPRKDKIIGSEAKNDEVWMEVIAELKKLL